jgi:hypothetical protein
VSSQQSVLHGLLVNRSIIFLSDKVQIGKAFL